MATVGEQTMPTPAIHTGPRFRTIAACSIAVTTLCGNLTSDASAFAAGKTKFNTVLAIDDKAPDWTGLPGVDDKPHSLGDYGAAKAVVVVFTCNHCPVATM